ncbi:hypothetical protein VIN30_02155 [Adlercreutzia sp. R7]|uniref:Uncharacterized protein n=1 Tax=Adlercreutzia wanghongyangiae TaxID=3111451 RepID=A0ABU6IFN6_9ACTN|nr:hypothetical protein [Adlercreutzia sp. R7]
MKLKEKYPWMNWRTVHWIALGCILAGMVLAGIGVLVASLDSHSWRDVVAHFDIISFGDANALAFPDAPEPPMPPSSPTLS